MKACWIRGDYLGPPKGRIADEMRLSHHASNCQEAL